MPSTGGEIRRKPRGEFADSLSQFITILARRTLND
jgi:hypothetical protein